jgi:hypothetical protein
VLNDHWSCPERHRGVGIKAGDHNVAWGCAVREKHDPRGGPYHCYTCKVAYKKPTRRQYAPTFHYDCDLMPWEHDPPGRQGALGAHRAGCPTKPNHEGGPGPKCYGCRMMYVGRKDDEPFLGRHQGHPHYAACALTPEEHPPARGVGRGHRTSCAVAEGHTKTGTKRCPKCRTDAGIPEQARAHGLRRRFGMAVSDYDALLAKQNGGCAICGGKAANGDRWAVDHDHATGAVRGLLCRNCNMGLGLFRDRKDVIERAIEYLRGQPD